MKYLTTAALALALIGVAGSALADPPPDKNKNVHPSTGGGHPPPPAHGAPPPGGAHGGPPPPGGVHPLGGFPGGGSGSHGGPPGGGPAGRYRGAPGPGGGHGGSPPPGGGYRGGPPGGGSGRPGFGFQGHALRPGDRGRSYYNPGAFQQQYSAPRRFRFDNYAYPGGWYARTWVYGDYLPDGWFTPDYYLDWGYYQLPEPPVGCEWVRQGPDAVLVDVWTGEVLSVESGLFY
jgi:hypothetical protein